ncbi:hypothetical protein PIB30_091291, partial [Stylosanthes scabra]|nr:hypothetical protein [Stylosanthes scabra]
NTTQTAQQKEKLIPRKRANPTALSKSEADVDTSVDAYGDEPDGGLARKVTKPNIGQPRQTKMDTRAASEISPDEDTTAHGLQTWDFNTSTSSAAKGIPPRSNMTRSSTFKDMASETHRDHANAHASKSTAMGDMAMPQHRRDLCGYVFNDGADETEVLLWIREHTATRSDFACLGNRARPISSRLIELFTLVMASNKGAGAGEVNAGALWYLPPRFAVYVPIFDDEGNKQWYLAVADLSGEAVFHLDTNFDKDIRKKRRQLITSPTHTHSKMRALHRLARSNEFVGIKFINPTNMGDWDVCGCTGQPRNSNTRDSALLVMQWMTMGIKFTHALIDAMKQKKARLSLTLEMLMSKCNQVRGRLLLNSEAHAKEERGSSGAFT